MECNTHALWIWGCRTGKHPWLEHTLALEQQHPEEAHSLLRHQSLNLAFCPEHTLALAGQVATPKWAPMISQRWKQEDDRKEEAHNLLPNQRSVLRISWQWCAANMKKKKDNIRKKHTACWDINVLPWGYLGNDALAGQLLLQQLDLLAVHSEEEDRRHKEEAHRLPRHQRFWAAHTLAMMRSQDEEEGQRQEEAHSLFPNQRFVHWSDSWMCAWMNEWMSWAYLCNDALAGQLLLKQLDSLTVCLTSFAQLPNF